MHRRWSAATLLVASLALTSPGARAAESAEVVDASDDVYLYGTAPLDSPCADAVDLQRLWVEWLEDGIHFHYEFDDLSMMGGAAQDGLGRCFYTYTYFEARIGGETVKDAVYMDFNAFPVYQTGWRFYLHEDRGLLSGTVDPTSGQIEVIWQNGTLPAPVEGDHIGHFRILASTAHVGLGYDSAWDVAPDNGGPCVCVVEAPAPPRTHEGNETSGPEDAEAPAPSVATVLIVLAVLVAVNIQGSRQSK
jgi:hypothetical protein